MKRKLLWSLIFLLAGSRGTLQAQTKINYVPNPVALYVSSDGTGNSGTFEPLAGSGGSTVAYVPQPLAMMYSTDGTGNAGTWAFCTATSCGGGGSGTFNALTGDATSTSTGGANSQRDQRDASLGPRDRATLQHDHNGRTFD